ncbi:MAG: Lrp/AsnC ligand binding domain-containing protein [Victivallaceae bacterium]|jgi:DNA-binding Lrp family transcriptional regulator|nr:Lrp/AsnC ligand binding domain-containing protein [Victivallaceae bacterium]MDD4317949.1 Lrp/AsnC ligand binding domain-containing protein [Victivallaceae bacterium]MDD5663717.1 Lrp/AsnC ligand binding domain-containing protein [Victivallaceae bacterium]NLK83417.1 Lrp/AsnC family transcriptional regulator [Lentisphaerota bacterium]
MVNGVTGIVLVNVERPMLKEVISRIMQLDGVSEVYTVAGEYDLVAMVRARDNRELADVVANKMMRDISGITHTRTLISLDVDSKFDLSPAFRSE